MMIRTAAGIVMAAGCLLAAPAFAANGEPPLEPTGEHPVLHPDDQNLAKCMAVLAPILQPLHQHLDAYVVSESRTWGQLLRADISSEDKPPVHTRFVCPLQSGSGRRPVVIAVEPKVPPLAPGPWGELHAGK
jgi:hypothetical protein